MKHLSQLDPAWKNVKIGESSLTVGNYGCTLACLSMISSVFGPFKTPEQLAKMKHLFTGLGHPQGAGMVLWKEFAKEIEHIGSIQRVYSHDEGLFARAIAEERKEVMIEVEYQGTAWARHWVVAVQALGGGDYIIIDPIGGVERRLKSRYKKILGGAVVTADETWQKTTSDESLDPTFAKELAKRTYPFFLQTESRGELWYVDEDGKREHITPERFETFAREFIEKYATGISNKDLQKVPLKK
jgi:hypothetical protein